MTALRMNLCVYYRIWLEYKRLGMYILGDNDDIYTARVEKKRVKPRRQLRKLRTNGYGFRCSYGCMSERMMQGMRRGPEHAADRGNMTATCMPLQATCFG